MAHEEAPLVVGEADQPDARIDQVHDDVAEQERLWEEDWKETLKDVQKWGPRLATAYRNVRQEVGGTIQREYDAEGELIPFDPAQEKAFKMQPDVLIVDLSLYDRSLRHPFPGAVKEEVFAAGWTILRREYPNPYSEEGAEEDDAADERPKAAKKRSTGILDDLVEIDVDEDVEEAGDAEEDDRYAGVKPKRNMYVERIVVTHLGHVLRFEGPSDKNPEGTGPLRFARILDAEELKETDKSTYDQLDGYMKDNDDHFVQRDRFNAEEALTPDKITKANLNRLPDDAPEDAPNYELEAWMVREGLADFLEERGLAKPDYLASLRA
jgi:hypothetical protein